MNAVLVSIVVPCYNQAQYLDEALASVLSQSYAHWECIIVNDGGQDHTEELAGNWCKKDVRFKYFYKKNGGLSSARNYGIEKAQGEFILPLDSDDKISQDYMTNAIAAFSEDNSLKVVYCKAMKFGDVNGIWHLKPFSLYNLSLSNVIFCSALFRKKDWELVGGYDEKMIYGLEDWEFWIAVLKNGGNVKCLNDVGFFYRVKSQSMIIQVDKAKRNYLYDYLSIKHADFYVKQLGSFNQLHKTVVKNNQVYQKRIKSKKFAIDVLCHSFFGFNFFKKL
jgi:glycosyltransferase involved in cell wall biosynthesis